jgi:hypothetical protein
MDQSIAHRDNSGPRHGWRCGARLRADAGGSFANDLDGSEEREEQHLIGVEIGAPPPRDESLRGFCRFNHVPNASDVITLHIGPRPSARPRHGSSGLSPGVCANQRACPLRGLTVQPQCLPVREVPVPNPARILQVDPNHCPVGWCLSESSLDRSKLATILEYIRSHEVESVLMQFSGLSIAGLESVSCLVDDEHPSQRAFRR